MSLDIKSLPVPVTIKRIPSIVWGAMNCFYVFQSKILAGLKFKNSSNSENRLSSVLYLSMLIKIFINKNIAHVESFQPLTCAKVENFFRKTKIVC